MTAPLCQVPGCGQPATHRLLYTYRDAPVRSDVCETHITGEPFVHDKDSWRVVKLEDVG